MRNFTVINSNSDIGIRDGRNNTGRNGDVVRNRFAVGIKHIVSKSTVGIFSEGIRISTVIVRISITVLRNEVSDVVFELNGSSAVYVYDLQFIGK